MHFTETSTRSETQVKFIIFALARWKKCSLCISYKRWECSVINFTENHVVVGWRLQVYSASHFSACPDSSIQCKRLFCNETWTSQNLHCHCHLCFERFFSQYRRVHIRLQCSVVAVGWCQEISVYDIWTTHIICLACDMIGQDRPKLFTK